MGGVDFSYLVPPGSTRRLTFTDTLIGADQPFYVGDSWIAAQFPNDATTTAQSLQGGANRSGAGMTFTNPFGAGFLPKGFFFPFNYDVGGAFARKQFVQFTVVSNPAGISRPFGLCYCNNNRGDWYSLVMLTEIAQLNISRSNAFAVTPIIVESVATAYANGDVVKMVCDPITTPGTTICTIFKNGIQIATANDNNASRLSTGITGLGFAGANPAVNTTISNYSGGGF